MYCLLNVVAHVVILRTILIPYPHTRPCPRTHTDTHSLPLRQYIYTRLYIASTQYLFPHTRSHTRIHTHTCTRAYTHAHTQTHTYVHTCTRAYAHAHAHAHACSGLSRCTILPESGTGPNRLSPHHLTFTFTLTLTFTFTLATTTSSRWIPAMCISEHIVKN